MFLSWIPFPLTPHLLYLIYSHCCFSMSPDPSSLQLLLKQQQLQHYQGNSSFPRCSCTKSTNRGMQVPGSAAAPPKPQKAQNNGKD